MIDGLLAGSITVQEFTGPRGKYFIKPFGKRICQPDKIGSGKGSDNGYRNDNRGNKRVQHLERGSQSRDNKSKLSYLARLNPDLTETFSGSPDSKTPNEEKIDLPTRVTNVMITTGQAY